MSFQWRFLVYSVLMGTGFGVLFLLLSSFRLDHNQLRNIRYQNVTNASRLDKCALKLKSEMSKKKSVDSVKILCFVLTDPGYSESAAMVKNTWGRRCNKFLLISSANDTNPDVIALPNVEEGYIYLWGKTKEALKYIWENHSIEFDWFMKADANTFVIVENLRLFLHDKNTEDPIYFGRRWYLDENSMHTYMYGGAGYVMSREALRRFVKETVPDENNCWMGNNGSEDIELGLCMESVGVEFGDSRDSSRHNLFMPGPPADHLGDLEQAIGWYMGAAYYPENKGLECCSDRAISFHYLTPNGIFTMEYLIYHLRPFGIPN